MAYDRKMLEAWAGTATWEEFLTREGAFNNVSKEVWQFIEQKYFRIVKFRIEHCKKLLTEYDDFYIHHVLAELHDRANLDGSAEYLFKRGVRFHCIKAIRENPDHAPTWALLAEAYIWLAVLGTAGKETPNMTTAINEQDIIVDIKRERSNKRYNSTLFFAERAIKCLKKAIAIDPQKKYIDRLKEFYGLKAEELEGKEFENIT